MNKEMKKGTLTSDYRQTNEEGGEFVEKPLTHVELSDKAGHVVVLKKLWENLFCKPLFIQYKETVPFL